MSDERKDQDLIAEAREWSHIVESDPDWRKGYVEDGLHHVARLADALEAVRIGEEDLPRETQLEAEAWKEAVKRVRSAYPEDVFPPGPPHRTTDAESADWARRVCDNIEAIAKEILEEGKDAENAHWLRDAGFGGTDVTDDDGGWR